MKAGRHTRYEAQHRTWRFRNLAQWALRVRSADQRRTPYPLAYLSQISFWVLNRDVLRVNRSNARDRLRHKRTIKRRK